MKHFAALLLPLLPICALTACGNQEREAPVFTTDTLVPLESTKSSKTESAQEPAEDPTNSNILIAYFSRYGNTE
ncbi:MAG: hypothetical protein Q4F83_04000 [Eubacteriales bacterium]|nr:hypothetical protein [Eubacteriales bacterium]